MLIHSSTKPQGQKEEEEKHNTPNSKNTALNTLLGVNESVGLTGQGTQAAVLCVWSQKWCCHGNHIPLALMGDQPGEQEQRILTKHYLYLCLSP